MIKSHPHCQQRNQQPPQLAPLRENGIPQCYHRDPITTTPEETRKPFEFVFFFVLLLIAATMAYLTRTFSGAALDFINSDDNGIITFAIS